MALTPEELQRQQQNYQGLAGGLLSGAGSYLQGSSAQGALSNQAAAQQQNANLAQFRPVGITSRFGQSGYNYAPSGQLIGAGYQVAPDIAAMREGAIGQAGGYLGQAGQAAGAVAPAMAGAQGLFNLGQQYIAQSPQEAAQSWMSQQQALLQPSRDVAYGQLQQNLQNTGRAGLSIAQGGQLGAANPEAQAYYNALAQQNAQLAAQAQQQGMEQTRFGAGLLGSGLQAITGGYGAQEAAYRPYTGAMQAAQGLEALGQAPMTTSAALGELGSTAGYRAGTLNNIAAGTAGTAASYSPWGTLLQGASSNPQVQDYFGKTLFNIFGT